MISMGNELICLISYSLHSKIPDAERIKALDMEALLKMCNHHSLAAIVSYALESAGIRHEEFLKEKSHAIRNIMLLDAERKRICQFLEENKIWYMPLKGVYMKEYYPKIGMRQMCDNDILVDASRIEEIDASMKQRGYSLHSEKFANDYGYLMPPCYNFEMHRSLFGNYHEEPLYAYYQNVKERLMKSENHEYEYHFTTEDFYIYMIAHEYKHFSKGGTGLRSLVDTYVYLNKFSESMNWEYIHEECQKLDIAEFEGKSRKLALKLFSSVEFPELDADEQKMLDYYLGSGTYGTVSNSTNNKIKKFESETGSQSKVRFLLHRVFPPMEHYKNYFPFFYKHKILLPIGWAYRLFRGIFCKNKVIQAEMKAIRSIEKTQE